MLILFSWVWFLVPTSAAADRNVVIVRSTEALHDLPDALVSKAHVHFTGTITYYDPAEMLLFVQDSRVGVFIHVTRQYSFHTGQLISVDGFAEKGFKPEVAPDAIIKLVGRGLDPTPIKADYASLASGQMDCQVVSIAGTVRDAVIEFHPQTHLSALHMDLSMPGGEVGVYVKDFKNLDPTTLLGAEIQIRAVAGGIFDGKQQLTGIMLHVPSSEDIRVISRPKMSAIDLPITNVSNVFAMLRTVDSSPRIHVRGTVVYYASGDSVVLEHDGQSLYLQTRETKALQVGQVVDAYGFADNHRYSPSLREAVLLPTADKETINPKPISYDQGLSGAFSDQLISLEGTVVSQLRTPGVETVTLNVDGHLVRETVPSQERIQEFPVGSLVRIIGVCEIVSGGPWHDPIYFSIASRTYSDIKIISPASWWTVRHLAILLAILLAAALAVALWAIILKGRVARRNKKIRRSMDVARHRSEILEQMGGTLPLDQILTQLPSVAMSLLPGCTAKVSLEPSRCPIAELNASELFRHRLDIETKSLGEFVIFGKPDRDGSDVDEVIGMLREVIGVVLTQRALQEKLLHHSTHDPLTNLPNRRLCEERINAAIQTGLKHSTELSIAYVDVDSFKLINDRHGHHVGDLYLKALSERMRSMLREEDMLARIGGDEFLILIPGSGSKNTNALLERLRSCFASPFALGKLTIDGSASFGIASFPEHGTCREELERHADSAMYVAKNFQRGKEGNALGMLTTHELEKALASDRFRLAYQPQFSPTGVLTGLEALIRLEDPVLGLIMPGSFIGVAESSGFIISLGDWVLQTALRQATEWQLTNRTDFILSVNVAAKQLEQPEFASKVLSYLEEVNFPAACLELELTERALLADNVELFLQVETLARGGVRISLDDFGTEHSCLSLLHRLPISTVKIDRSFVQALKVTRRALPVVEAIVAMAQRLRMRVVAEGVEDPETISQLLEVGDMEFQGYWFSRPVPSGEVAANLSSWCTGAAMSRRNDEAA